MQTRAANAEQSPVSVSFCLVFPHEALSVPVMRHVLGDTLRGLGADDEGVGDLLLAVTEACTNVLKHGGPGLRYEIVATVSPQGCLVEVVNPEKRIRPSDLPGARWPVWLLPPVIRGGRRPSRTPPALRHLRRVRQRTSDEFIASLPENGRGLAIMRACVDDVTLSNRPEQGTVVSLQKRIAWRNDAPLARLPAALKNAG
jgi:serine/threonine-protein kinase RsbW